MLRLLRFLFLCLFSIKNQEVFTDAFPASVFNDLCSNVGRPFYTLLMSGKKKKNITKQIRTNCANIKSGNMEGNNRMEENDGKSGAYQAPGQILKDWTAEK